MGEYNELANRCMELSGECFGAARDALHDAALAIRKLEGSIDDLEKEKERLIDDGK